MKSAIAIRHVAFEDLGSLEPILERHGYRFEYREAGVDRLSANDADTDLLIVLGGPIAVYDDAIYPFIAQELALLEKRLARDLPTVGICLGAQLMARALGSRVYPGKRKEIGWAPLTLDSEASANALSPLEGVPVLHWHGDTFDIPDGAVHLASTDACRNQAFAWRRRGLALQFHAEVRPAALERWYIGHACEISATAGISVAALRAEAARHGAALQKPAEVLWANWISSLD